jgi:hypothetical protein
MPNTISVGKVTAMQEFKDVLDSLTREGLIRLLVDTYGIFTYDGNSNVSRSDLIEQVMVCEYELEDLEAFNANS